MIRIAPSILAADFSRLGEQVAEAERAGADRIHVDVMDGHFVPNLSMGPIVVEGLRPRTRLPLEVHLMVREPARFVSAFIKAGADSLLVHHEVLPEPAPLLREIKRQGKRVGLVVNPDTPIEVLEPLLPLVDLALCMTVQPGFSGQAFLPYSPERIRRLRALIDRIQPSCELEVDGGITSKTLPVTLAAGANVFVVGSGVFGHPEGIGAAMQELAACGHAGTETGVTLV